MSTLWEQNYVGQGKVISPQMIVPFTTLVMRKGGSNGVAFVISSFSSRHILGYNPVSDRIISIRTQTQRINFSIIQVYSPTFTAADDEFEYFYNEFQDTLNGIPNRDIIMITGDFNAKVGVQHEDETMAEMIEVAHLLTSA